MVGAAKKLFLPIIVRNYPPFSWFDNFSDPSSGWYVGDNGAVAMSYQSGEYEILMRNANSFAWATAPTKQLSANYSFSADMRRYSGSNSAYGLLFDYVSGTSFYAFEVQPGLGQYSIFQYDNSSWKIIQNWTADSSINTFTGTNHLEIVRNAGDLGFYINGKLVTSASGDTTTGVLIGLVAQSSGTVPISVHYDNFQVSGTLSSISSLSSNNFSPDGALPGGEGSVAKP